jgi:hypothetical protein
MYIHRELEKKIAPFVKRKEALSIIGPRQAGKTTFIKFIASELERQKKKVKFITFEKRGDLELFQNSIEDFKDLISEYQYVIIDEFQYAKDGGQKLKYLYDTAKVKFIISGSSSLELTFQTGKYIVGRLLDFQLLPFSFREFLSFQDKELHRLLERRVNTDSFFNFDIKSGFGKQINKRLADNLEKYIIYGGYPAVALSATEQEKKKTLAGIVENYLLKDIKGLLNLATEDELIKLSKFLALQIGNMVKYEELSNASGLSYKETLKHLNILEKTFIVKLIRPYFTNKRTELTKNPKSYFIDLGIRNFLIDDFRPLQARNDSGAVMENYAYNLLQNLGMASGLKYWRTKSKAEVDFVVEKQRNIYPIETKYVSKKIIGKSFYSFIDKFKPKTGIILTKDYLGEEKIKNTKVKFIPLSYF